MPARLGPPPPATSANASATMRANRRRDTGPELALRAALRAAGFTGYRVDMRSVPGRPDIAFRRHKLAIFVHGCFWHRCPTCRLALPKGNREFWKRKFELNEERDERKRRALEALGWNVLELWECEVTRDASQCVSRVARQLAHAADAHEPARVWRVAERPRRAGR